MDLDRCGCCDPGAPETPVAVTNRPGLSAIACRIGTFAAFRATMLQAIAREPVLRALTTRESDDTAITVLELWAAVADVLTFYQERIASEAFLRTARERDSVLRLARLLDYHLRPGLAATVLAAFTADDGATVRVPVGLRMMSVPGQDEQPQFFQTVEAITADARLNALRVLPRPAAVNPLAQGRQTAFLTTDPAGWKTAAALRPGDRVVLFGSGAGGASVGGGAGGSYTYGDTVGWGLPDRPIGQVGDVRVQLTYWQEQIVQAFAQPTLVGASDALEEKEIREVRVEGDRFLLVWTGPVVKATHTAATQARVFTRTMRVFGHDAPGQYTTMTLVNNPSDSSLPKIPQWGTKVLTLSDYALAAGADLPLDTTYKDLVPGDQLLVYEAGGTPQPVTVIGRAEGEMILGSAPSGEVDHRYRATITAVTVSPALTAIADRRKVTVYQLKGGPIPLWTGDFSDLITSGSLYLPAATLDAAGETVEIGRTIVGQELKAGTAIGLKEIDKGRTVLLHDHARQPVAAVIRDRRVETVEGQEFLVIEVTAASPIQLETRTAVLLGNVALATHGDAVPEEILGDGDAATPFQRFTLKRKPLTYVPSAGRAAGESTLTVRVNGVEWTGADSLYGQAPTAQVYTARQADDGTTTVQFGDGTTGARVPSGRGNVVATYRQGSGLAGRVRADQLSILLERPVGLKAATNPAPAEGGADPETLDRARTTAPTTVKTFDRAVSLLDFETLATASGEIARAKATLVRHGLQHAVHLTVAGQKGGAFSGETLARLHAGLTAQRDPNRPLLLANVARVPVLVEATIQVDERHEAEKVREAARAALLAFFDFDRMPFARPVHLSALYRVLHDVPGVRKVDIDRLGFKKPDPLWSATQFRDYLLARGISCQVVGTGVEVLDPLPAHLRIFAARVDPGGGVLPAEQAYVENEAGDITLSVVEAPAR